MGRLTALQIRNLKEPGRYSDGDGLSLLLSALRKGYWVLRATIKGRRRDIGLGTADLITLKEARGMALELRLDIQRGIDPIAEREKEEIKILTFAEAARKVHQEQKAGWKNGKHQEQWITTLEKYAFPMLGKRLVPNSLSMFCLSGEISISLHLHHPSVRETHPANHHACPRPHRSEASVQPCG